MQFEPQFSLNVGELSASGGSVGAPPATTVGPTHVVLTAHICVSGRVVVGRADGLIVSYRLSDARGEKFWHGHGGTITDLLFCEDYGAEGVVFSASADRTIKLWEPHLTTDGQPSCIQTLRGHGSTVTSLQAGVDCLISGSNDRSVYIWGPDPGRQLMLHPWFSVFQVIDLSAWATACALRCGEITELFICSSEGNVSVFSPPTPMNKTTALAPFELVRRYQNVHRLGITKVQLVPEQNLLITASFDQTVRVLDSTTGAHFLTISSPDRCRFVDVHWHAREQELFVLDEKSRVSAYNIYMDKCLKREKIGSGKGSTLSLLGDQLVVTSGPEAHAVHVSRELKFVEFTGHDDAVIAVIATDDETDEQHIFSASLDNTIRCWDAYDMTELYALRETVSEISCCVYLPDCSLFASGHDNGMIKWWNPDSSSTIALKQHRNTVSCLCAAHYNRSEFLISGGFDGKVGIWDITKRRSVKPRLEFMLQAHTGDEPEILCVAYSPLHNIFITGGNDCVLRLWHIRTYALQAKATAHTDAVTCLAFDANFAFSGSEDCTVRIWNVATAKRPYLVTTLRAHSCCVRDILIVPDTGFLVSCALDGVIRVWDYAASRDGDETGAILREISHSDGFRCLSYRSARSQIIAGTEEHRILLFPLPSDLRDRRSSSVDAASQRAAIREQLAREMEAEVASENGAAGASAGSVSGSVSGSGSDSGGEFSGSEYTDDSDAETESTVSEAVSESKEE